MGPDGTGTDLSAALDAIEAAAGDGTIDASDLGTAYRQIRPRLERLLSALEAAGGDTARVAGVLANLMAGADTLASAPELAGGVTAGMPATTEASADAI